MTLSRRLMPALAILLTVAVQTRAVRGDDLDVLLRKTAGAIVREQFSEKSLDRAERERHNGKLYTTRSQDGWTLVAHRFSPKGKPKAGAAPVILCHGLSYNALFWNLDPLCSLPDYLTTAGYDVWVLDLRGCGLSTKWVWKIDDLPSLLIGDAFQRLAKGKNAPTGNATLDLKFANWTLDHHIYYDVPAFVNLVRKQTGAAEVTWVGHSMGGIVALGHLARFGNPGIGRLVTVGSQVTMPNGQVVTQFAKEMLETRESQIAGKLMGRELLTRSKSSVDNLFFNQSNAPAKVYEALSGWAKDVPSIGLMKQYLVLAETTELWDSARKFNYAKAVDKIKVPILITCGAADQLAPPSAQKYLFDHIGSVDKKAFIFGIEKGLSVDCGHDDTLVGKNSRAEVYPIIEQWIAGKR